MLYPNTILQDKEEAATSQGQHSQGKSHVSESVQEQALTLCHGNRWGDTLQKELFQWRGFKSSSLVGKLKVRKVTCFELVPCSRQEMPPPLSSSCLKNPQMLRPHHCLQKSKCEVLYWNKIVWWGMELWAAWSQQVFILGLSFTGRRTIPEIRSVFNKPSDARAPSHHDVIESFDGFDPCIHSHPQLELLGTAISPTHWCPCTQHLEKGIRRKEHPWNNSICIKHLSCNCTIPTCH